MKVAITGASGMIGSELRDALTADGHAILQLVRSKDAAARADRIYWSPSDHEIDAAGLEGQDVVIHLAGESTFGVWTESKKRRIRRSRVQGTELLASTLAALESPPRLLITASGINYYGDRPGERLDESASRGTGFMADVAAAWEAAAQPATTAGIRLVHLRFGLVLSERGGVLSLLLPAFRWGVGGVPGDGRQVWSWIALAEIPHIVRHVMAHEEIEGPVNSVSPDSVTAERFCKALGEVLHRPVALRVPAPLMRLAPGGFADELALSSQDVAPAVLERTGYTFTYRDYRHTLEALLG